MVVVNPRIDNKIIALSPRSRSKKRTRISTGADRTDQHEHSIAMEVDPVVAIPLVQVYGPANPPSARPATMEPDKRRIDYFKKLMVQGKVFKAFRAIVSDDAKVLLPHSLVNLAFLQDNHPTRADPDAASWTPLRTYPKTRCSPNSASSCSRTS